MDYIIISAANDLFINTIIDFIHSFPLNHSKLILYDLGFSEDNLKLIHSLKNKYNFVLKTFNYDNYSEHVNLKLYNGLYCSYAFKPIIIYNEATEEYNKDKIIIWMDSSNRFELDHINHMINITTIQGIYTPLSANKNSIESIELNHHKTVSHYNLSEFEHIYLLESISANLICFNYNSKSGSEILNQWYRDSLNKDIITPPNTSRNNHRQDQTVLSIIIFLYEKHNNNYFYKKNIGFSFWNNKDLPTIQEGLKQFKLFDKNNKQLAIIYCRNYDEAVLTYADRKNISVQDFCKDFNVV